VPWPKRCCHYGGDEWILDEGGGGAYASIAIKSEKFGDCQPSLWQENRYWNPTGSEKESIWQIFRMRFCYLDDHLFSFVV
jgi:hypothetical protein